MEVYHLGVKKFADQLTGEGAKLHGGRWNSIGTACIYTAESISLCVLEYAANVPLHLMPSSLAITVYIIPDGCWKEFLLKDLPNNWQEVPAPMETQEWGSSQLLAADFIALKLPSVIIPTEHNYLLNPLHPHAKDLKVIRQVPVSLDPRLLDAATKKP